MECVSANSTLEFLNKDILINMIASLKNKIVLLEQEIQDLRAENDELMRLLQL